ncbi:MAG: LysE family transporter [Chloroflexota bacterium]
MVALLAAGIVFGLSAGFSPGPLLTLVITQTLQHGIKEGVRVAFAPLITDAPIILLSAFVLAWLANFHALLGIISLAGGCFVLYLAFESFRTTQLTTGSSTAAPNSLQKGALVNALNPHPYLFWFTVGAPTIVKAWQETPIAAAAFLAGFYSCLIGAKIVITLLVGASRQFFSGKAYAYLMRILGALLFVFALVLFADGLRLLGVLK